MFHSKDVDEPTLVFDLVDDSVGAAPGRPESGEFTLEWMTDLTWVLAERSEQELDHSGGDPFR